VGTAINFIPNELIYSSVSPGTLSIPDAPQPIISTSGWAATMSLKSSCARLCPSLGVDDYIRGIALPVNHYLAKAVGINHWLPPCPDVVHKAVSAQSLS
jgi:hypothetical protein